MCQRVDMDRSGNALGSKTVAELTADLRAQPTVRIQPGGVWPVVRRSSEISRSRLVEDLVDWCLTAVPADCTSHSRDLNVHLLDRSNRETAWQSVGAVGEGGAL
jgi:hypothetical protein